MRATLRTIGLATAATLATTFAALAADKTPARPAAAPAAAPAPAPAPVAAPAFTWTGGYLGIQGGGLWNNFTSTVPSGTFSYRTGGGSFGLYAGYNMQFDGWVVGFDGSYNWDFSKQGNFDTGEDSKSKWHALARARVGYAAGSSFLLYASGGAAFANLFTERTVAPVGNDERSEAGWTLGAGIEGALTNNIITRLDYAYIHYNDFIGVAGNAYTTTLAQNQVTAGIALKY